MKLFSYVAAMAFCATELVSAYGGKPVCNFNNTVHGSMPLAAPGLNPTIVVSQSDLWGVQRAAQDLSIDFGRVTGHNGTLLNITGNSLPSGHPSLIVVGTVGSPLINNLVASNKINLSAITGQWESFMTQLVSNPAPGIQQALVIIGADKRGAIYGIYDLSQQIGVSPWHFWADVPTIHQDVISALPTTKISKSPSVKYRGIFLNDEAPALTGWVLDNFPPTKYGPGFNVNFYELVFELLLRLRANYLWPAEWNSFFYVDDTFNGPTADAWGVVIGTSHTEPLARATKEQSLFLNGTWAWQSNQANVTEFLREGVERAASWETLWTMGMRGLGDTSSPTLNATQLETIIGVEQQLLEEVLKVNNLKNVPQMWCLYKEVGGYFEQGMTVPDDITLLWADDNWGNPERLPIGNETTRLAGNGIYYHFDYVGAPRDYKWINTMNLPYVHEKLVQSYERSAKQIWVFNVGDLKPLEIPINFAMDLAFNIDEYHQPNSTLAWTQDWAASNYGPALAPQISQLMMNYSLLAGRRKYELMDINFFSLVNYNEFDRVISEWVAQATAAQAVYDQLPSNAKASFFEMILHPSLAGMTLYQMYYVAARNNLYAEQGRNSANQYLMQVFDWVNRDANLTMTYNGLLNSKWSHMMDQTHFGYDNYWQQPMRNSLPGSLSYVQTQLDALPGYLGVTVEGGNGTLPGDDQFHGNGGSTLQLPPMDPFMTTPSRWIDIFSRTATSSPVTFYVNTTVPYVKASIVNGTLAPMGSPNQTDVRVYITVDWANAPVGDTSIVMTVSTTSGINWPFGQAATTRYGTQYNVPQIMLTLNNTQARLPSNFSGFVQSDGVVSIEPEHFTINKTTTEASAYYAVIPGYGRTLSGVTLLPATAPVQNPNISSAPVLQYSFYTFNKAPINASLSIAIGPTLNTDPNHPVEYAVSIDNGTIQHVRPIPVTVLGSYGTPWTNMVSNFSTYNITTHPIMASGAHTLNLWAVTPSITFQKLVLNLGGLRDSYLGPPESLRVNV